MPPLWQAHNATFMAGSQESHCNPDNRVQQAHFLGCATASPVKSISYQSPDEGLNRQTRWKLKDTAGYLMILLVISCK